MRGSSMFSGRADGEAAAQPGGRGGAEFGFGGDDRGQRGRFPVEAAAKAEPGVGREGPRLRAWPVAEAAPSAGAFCLLALQCPSLHREGKAALGREAAGKGSGWAAASPGMLTR